MKCIRCGTDNNLQDRTAHFGRCSNCNHPFVFEPTTMKDVKITDPLFQKAIADISANNTLFFTPKQFLYFLDKRIKNKLLLLVSIGDIELHPSFQYILYFIIIGSVLGFLPIIKIIEYLWPTIKIIGYSIIKFDYFWALICVNIYLICDLFYQSNSQKSNLRVRRKNIFFIQILGGIIAIGGIYYGISTNSLLIYGVSAIVGLSAFWLGFLQKKRLKKIPQILLINASQMLSWLDSWTRINGSVTQLLPAPSITFPAPNALPDPTVTQYSFDRLVVCQSDEVAQMLIANNFHFENNCAILSISGYPQRIFDTTMQMLRRNPELRVFAFHDCSPEGIKLAQELRTNPRWFPDETIVIVDIGLSPRQILAAKRDMFIQSSKNSAQASRSLPSSLRENLSKVELEWLDRGNFVELESFTPQQLIQVLNRSIANSQQGELGEDGTLILVGGSDSYFYVTESFG
jgi:hypothetical protein